MRTLQTLTVQEPNPIGYWQLYDAKQTIHAIRMTLRSYFEAVEGKKPEDVELAARRYLTGRGKNVELYKRDVETYFVSMKERPPKTIHARLSHTRQFLLRNNIDPGQLFWKDLKRKVKGNRAVTVDEVPSNEELRKVLNHLPVHGRALFLTLASSGMRIGEALELKLDDMNLKTDPPRLTVRAENTKSGGQRTVFISREARETIQQWLQVRAQWLESAVKKSTFEKKKATDPRLFPLTRMTVNEMYTRALEKAGFLKRDPRTGIATFHIHTLRKFFRTRLAPIIPVDIVEALMGHEAYLSQAYRRYTIDQLAEFYRKGEPSLWVLSETGQLAHEVQETRELLAIQIARLTKENEDLKTNLTKQVKDTESFEKKVMDEIRLLKAQAGLGESHESPKEKKEKHEDEKTKKEGPSYVAKGEDLDSLIKEFEDSSPRRTGKK